MSRLVSNHRDDHYYVTAIDVSAIAPIGWLEERVNSTRVLLTTQPGLSSSWDRGLHDLKRGPCVRAPSCQLDYCPETHTGRATAAKTHSGTRPRACCSMIPWAHPSPQQTTVVTSHTFADLDKFRQIV